MSELMVDYYPRLRFCKQCLSDLHGAPGEEFCGTCGLPADAPMPSEALASVPLPPDDDGEARPSVGRAVPQAPVAAEKAATPILAPVSAAAPALSPAAPATSAPSTSESTAPADAMRSQYQQPKGERQDKRRGK